MESTNTLRSLTINRITSDLIEGTISEVPDSFVIIIVDDYSAKVLSNYMTMTQVLNQGIFSVESLNKPRHQFPNYHALYFLSPTERSIKILTDDFKDTSKPKYSHIHLYFTHQVDQDVFSKLVTNGIVKRTVTCKELNLSFFVREQNVFDLGFDSGLKIFTASEDIQRKMILAIADRLFTVCATLNIYPYIQYQKNSKLCVELCERLEERLTKFGKAKGITRNGIVLLTDRSIDAISPLLHDYNYESLVYDLFDIKNDTVVLGEKKSKLTDTDELWACYKSLHVAQVFNKLSKDFEEFQKSDLSKVGKGDNLDSFEDMANALTKMGSYKLKSAQFATHLDLADELNAKYKANNLYDIIELEQDIVTGENENGKINNRDIFKNFTILKSKIQNQRDDLIRLLMILYSSLSIIEKDFNVLAGKLTDDEQLLFKNLSYLGIEKGASSKTERREVTTKNKLTDINTNKLNEKLTFKTIRNSPQLEILVERASNFALDLDKFPIKNWDRGEFPKVQKKYGTKNLFGGAVEIDDDTEDLGTLIMFCIGGLSRNEIAAIDKLSKDNLVNHKIVLGSTSLINANEYMRNLIDINKDKGNVIARDLLEESGAMVNQNVSVSPSDITIDVLKP